MIESGVLGVLGAAVAAVIALCSLLIRDREALSRIRERELVVQALSDPLTGLANRRALAARLEEAFARQQPLVVALIDLDRFKTYNDALGHTAGDELLRRLAGELSAVAEPDGLACRLGGDEFCVIVPATEADRLQQAVLGFEERAGGCSVSASYGSVRVPEEAGDTDAALVLADERMYRHKSERRLGWRGRDSSPPAA